MRSLNVNIYYSTIMPLLVIGLFVQVNALDLVTMKTPINEKRSVGAGYERVILCEDQERVTERSKNILHTHEVGRRRTRGTSCGCG